MTLDEQAAHGAAENDILRQASGEVRTNDKLVSFLYELMRDHISPGKVQGALINSTADGDVAYSNGFLANYAAYVAKRLRE